jgi:hypothetical protein
MKAPITSAQAMSHPTVVETINTLGGIAVELRAELATARADEREACIKLVQAGTGEPVQTKTLLILQKDRKRIADAIQARGTT